MSQEYKCEWANCPWRDEWGGCFFLPSPGCPYLPEEDGEDEMDPDAEFDPSNLTLDEGSLEDLLLASDEEGELDDYQSAFGQGD